MPLSQLSYLWGKSLLPKCPIENKRSLLHLMNLTTEGNKKVAWWNWYWSDIQGEMISLVSFQRRCDMAVHRRGQNTQHQLALCYINSCYLNMWTNLCQNWLKSSLLPFLGQCLLYPSLCYHSNIKDRGHPCYKYIFIIFLQGAQITVTWNNHNRMHILLTLC